MLIPYWIMSNIKVAFHSYQLGERGSEVCLYKYAKYNREILGNESIVISTSSRPTPGIEKFKEFETILYPDVWVNDGKNNSIRKSIEKICEKKSIDAFYAIKGGEDDGIMPKNTKSLSHCIFRVDQPHGDVYSSICKYMSEKYGSKYPYVHHIIENECPKILENFRAEFSIPKNALVLGRYGGYDQFSIPFTYNSISKSLEKRSDIYFLFMNTRPFIDHERVIYLPMSIDIEYKSKFVNTCDAMIHSRIDGEVMSMSIAEFSVKNKPIITWNPKNIPTSYDTGHIYLLGEEAIYYKDETDLNYILINLDKKEINKLKWNTYCQDYTPKKVMSEFKNVYF